MPAMTSTSKRIRRMARYGFVVAMMTGLWSNIAAAADLAQSDCPWRVLPDEPFVGLGADIATYDILLAGRPTDAIFYGFTVADSELAQQLDRGHQIPDLRQHGRPLKAIEHNESVVYRLSKDSMSPRVIFLLSAAKTIPELEMIDARIAPPRPVSVSWRTRGASDVSGPMPRRSVPGTEVLASAPETDFKLCAYQVSWN